MHYINNPLQPLRHTIAVEGLDNAMKMARTLIENDYQVVVKLDDCDVYVISYEYDDDTFGDNFFVSVSPDEYEKSSLNVKRRSATPHVLTSKSMMRCKDAWRTLMPA